MAPEILKKMTVPMNFGTKLLRSPTHNNLLLEASQGEVVKASSVILSFNSPVIDHITTELHLTCLDMKEFSRQAVQIFVDAAYAGQVADIGREAFRDVNKMAHVFEVSWLVSKCEEQFCKMAKLILKPEYHDLLFLFEEAAYARKFKLKTSKFKEVAFKMIKSMEWEQPFISQYLEELNSFSSASLDILIELSGKNVSYIVQPIVRYLEREVKTGTETTLFPEHIKYLLNKCELSLYRKHSVEMFEQLFDLLREVLGESEHHYKWIFDLYRSSSKKEVAPILELSDLTELEEKSKTQEEKLGENEILLNVVHNLDCSMELKDFIDWMGNCTTVRNLMMFAEGLIAWMDVNPNLIPQSPRPDILEQIIGIKQRRHWKPIPLSFFEFLSMFVRDRSKNFVLFLKTLIICKDIVTITEDEWHEEMIMLDDNINFKVEVMLRKKIGRHRIECKPSGMKKCSQPGRCGFILKTVWHDETGLQVSLSKDPQDYPKSLHYHEEITADNIHVQPMPLFLHPMTWHTVPCPNIMKGCSVNVITMNVFIAK